MELSTAHKSCPAPNSLAKSYAAHTVLLFLSSLSLDLLNPADPIPTAIGVITAGFVHVGVVENAMLLFPLEIQNIRV